MVIDLQGRGFRGEAAQARAGDKDRVRDQPVGHFGFRGCRSGLRIGTGRLPRGRRLRDPGGLFLPLLPADHEHAPGPGQGFKLCMRQELRQRVLRSEHSGERVSSVSRGQLLREQDRCARLRGKLPQSSAQRAGLDLYGHGQGHIRLLCTGRLRPGQ